MPEDGPGGTGRAVLGGGVREVEWRPLQPRLHRRPWRRGCGQRASLAPRLPGQPSSALHREAAGLGTAQGRARCSQAEGDTSDLWAVKGLIRDIIKRGKLSICSNPS